MKLFGSQRKRWRKEGYLERRIGAGEATSSRSNKEASEIISKKNLYTTLEDSVTPMTLLLLVGF
jgi:hypothetical protein